MPTAKELFGRLANRRDVRRLIYLDADKVRVVDTKEQALRGRERHHDDAVLVL